MRLSVNRARAAEERLMRKVNKIRKVTTLVAKCLVRYYYYHKHGIVYPTSFSGRGRYLLDASRRQKTIEQAGKSSDCYRVVQPERNGKSVKFTTRLQKLKPSI